MSKNSNDYLESLFTGIDILIDKKLENISYDTTIICTIVDDSNRKNGEYKVTDGSVIYVAYADVDNYVKGNQVRVTIPGGDFSQQKFITGKYAANTDSNPITYISPTDTIMNVSGNLITNLKCHGIVANGKDKSRVLWNKTLDESFIAMQNNNIYNTIIMKADFKTMLNNYDLIAGNYGLRLDFLIRPSAKSSVLIRRYIEFDSSEMFGNPYSFSIWSPQAKVIKLNTIGIVEAIELSIYQKGNFEDKQRGLIVPFNTLNAVDDILIDNVVLGLGCDLGDVEDNTLQIYTENDRSYIYGHHNTDTNLKTMGLLWLNKDDNNKYIGFSDGIYSPDYDELDYIKKSKADLRLMSQKGKDGIPPDKMSLELAANIEEAEKSIEEALRLITIDLVQLLREFKFLVEDVDSFNMVLDTLIGPGGDPDRHLITITDDIKNNLSSKYGKSVGLVESYKQILNYGYETWTDTPTADRKTPWKSEWEQQYGETIRWDFEKLFFAIESLLDSESGFKGIYTTYSGLASIYDTYMIRINRLIATIKGHLGQLTEDDPYYYLQKYFPNGVLGTNDYNKLQQYKIKSKTDFTLYVQPDLSEYDNKYCIYWYRYEKDYINNTEEQLMPDGWRRLKPEDFNSPHSTTDDNGINIGLPGLYKDLSGKDIVNDQGKPIYASKPENGKGLIRRYMQNDWQQEKYTAVLFFNHNMYKSNELIFTNSEVIPDKTTLDKGDILIFEHLTNSQDDFQSYGITNYLMDAADESRIRQIRCHYDGLLAKDNAFVNGQIYWYVPNVSTMLTVDIDDLIKNKGFVIDSTRSDTNGYKQVKFLNKYYEKDTYYILDGGKYKICGDEPNTSNPGNVPNNHISYYEKNYNTYCFYKKVAAKKITDTAEYEWDKWDYTNDTEIDNRDFWYKIKPYYEASATNNEIRCVFLKHEDVDEVQGVQLFTFGLRGTCGTKYTLAITNTSSNVAANATQGLDLKAQLKNFNNETLTLEDKNFEIDWEYLNNVSAGTPALACENREDSSTQVNFNTCAGAFGIIKATAQIMLKSDGKIQGDSVDISETDDATSVGKLRRVDLNVLHAIPYTLGDYYIQGPTQIVYNSLGTLDGSSMFNTPYKLFAKKEVYIDSTLYKKDEEIPVVWECHYYIKVDDNWILLDSIEDQSMIDFYKSYMPKIQNDNLVPGPIYLENNDCQLVVCAKQVGTTSTMLWQQPIIILQNRYASSMLNDWDGSFIIDEKNGTIMSSMVGAGRKTSNNTFEGVVMGNVALGTSSSIGFENGDEIGLSNQTGLGIYGFHDGAQSFGFNIDGTAFLGKSGSGRIIFNGEHGTIASANWYTGEHNSEHEDYDETSNPYPNRGIIDKTTGKITKSSNAGMCIDLDSGWMDAYNFKLTSKNIYLNSNPIHNPDDETDIRYGVTNIYEDDDSYYLRIGEENKTGFLSLDTNGKLSIRVNSLQITGNLGNENLLRQTWPRDGVVVPHWIEVERTAEAVESRDADGNVTISYTAEKTGEYVKVNYLPGTSIPIYTYDVSAWIKAYNVDGVLTSADGDEWFFDKSYESDVWVYNRTLEERYSFSPWGQTNYWKNISGVTIEPFIENPPGNNLNWKPFLEVVDDEIGTGVKTRILRINEANGCIVQRLIDFKINSEYTVSGYIRLDEAEKIFSIFLEDGCEVVYSNLDNEIEFKQDRRFTIPDTNWHYFRCTFTSPEEMDNNNGIGFSAETPFELWHLKLEEGSVATSWSISPFDIEGSLEDTKASYDNYLHQDIIFDKLFKDPKTNLVSDGIVLLDSSQTLTGRPELYISATYISSGILRSKNWDGTLKSTYDTDLKTYIYDLDITPTQGMYLNLNEGKMWAAKFELNAWDYTWDPSGAKVENGKGLYLNSDPALSEEEKYQYYLKVGDLDKGYITFDVNNNLKIKATSFELTGNIGGTNLLNDTAPRQAENEILYNFNEDTDEKKSGVQPYKYAYWGYNTKSVLPQIQYHDENRKCIMLMDAEDKTTDYRAIYQNIDHLSSSKDYILSGWVHVSNLLKPIEFIIRPKAGSTSEKYVVYKFQPDSPGWHYIQHVYRLSEESQKDGFAAYVTPRFIVKDWNYAEEGDFNCTYVWHLKLEEGTVATQWEESVQDRQDYVNIYDDEILLQEAVFNKLTEDGKAQGIFLHNGQLYINALYISTGILRSQNWEGTYKIERNGEEETESYDQSKLTGLLESGDEIKVIDIKPDKGMLINLNDGTIWAKTFKLDAWNSGGVYVSSTPDKSQPSYFRTGTTSDYLRYYQEYDESDKYLGNKFEIKTSNLTLQSGTAETTDYIALFSDDQKKNRTVCDTEKKTWRIIAGKNFGVDKAGNLYANAGYIGGWKINSTELSTTYAKDGFDYNLYLASKDSDKANFVAARARKTGTSDSWEYYFRISKEGGIYATKGKIGGCSITDGKLQVPAAQVTGTLAASQINADNLTVKAANITGKITASQINTTNLTVASAATITGDLSVSKLTANGEAYFETTGYGIRIYANDRNSYFIIGPASCAMYYYSNIMTLAGTGNVFRLIAKNSGGGEFGGTWTMTSEAGIVSDRNKKNSIESFDNRYNNFFDTLQPRRFKYNDGTSDRYHSGFIAQEVEDALNISNIDSQEFAGFIRMEREETVYYLRYENFIALNTWQIQKLKNKVSELENKIAQLEGVIKNDN